MGKLESVIAGAPQTLSRRHFLITAAAGSAVFGFAPTAQAAMDPAHPGAPIKPEAGPLFEPTIWFSIDEAGLVTVNVIRAEMGQHVGTSLARILADELEADWRQVRVSHVDSDPKWGLMVTGGSWSVWQTYPVFSQAGAAGRMALIAAGAKAMGVAPGACVARSGRVIAGDKAMTYGEIVKAGGFPAAYTPDELAKLPLKPVSERRLIGKSTPALDIPPKTTGAAIFGIDAKVPGMVYARPKLPPTRNGSKVVSVDDSAAKDVRGYIQSLVLNDPSDTVPGWVMVIAKTYPAAIKAADLVKVDWTPGAAAKVSEKDIQDHAASLLADSAKGAVLDTGGGDLAAAFAGAKSTLSATYTTSSALHFQMEPVNALAFEKDGVFEIHTGNQWQSLILPTLAKALGRPETSIVMRTYLMGGGFGRRLNGDYAVPAALASKALGLPVKMILTRADDARFDSFRSPSVQSLRMAFGEGGRVVAMDHAACAGWPTEVMVPAFMPKGVNGVPYDPFAIAGADHWYDVGVQRVRAVSNDLANQSFRPGWLRSVGPGWTNWAVESFMDEAAHAVGSDPVAFRLAHLTGKGRDAGGPPTAVGGALRQAAVVKLAAERAGWGQPLPAGSGRGIATTFGQERDMPTWSACVARVRVDRASGKVTVEKLTLVVDAGTLVDPDGALAQVQGAALWGLSLALHEGTSFANGQVSDTNLDGYRPLRIGDTPRLDIHFMDSDQPPVGLGEPATTVVGPAIGNAIFAATGARLRHLPIRAPDVVQALRTPA
jgi:CO/xanthine dehydrogenase Mo-binding subunit